MFRDKRSLLFLVAMPIAFTFFMGFAYRSGSDENADNRIPFAVVNPEPGSRLNKMFFTRLELSDSIRVVVCMKLMPWMHFIKGMWPGCW